MTNTDQRVLTPTAGKVFRRSLFWIAAAVFSFAIAIFAFASAGNASAGPPLDSANAAPAGSMAVAEVLRQQGVQVIATSTLSETREVIDSRAATTLFIYDPAEYLDKSALRQAVSLAAHTVFADPTFSQLRAVSPAVAQAGYVSETLSADCAVATVRRAGTVSGPGSGFRIVDQESDATGCLGSGDNVFSLIDTDDGRQRLTILGATGAITNEFVANDGNAAFALGLLGETDTLVWYLPSFADVPAAGPETIGELSPSWVIPVTSLLAITVIFAAIWRGRRLGPLVIENLPVTVRASETMQGRARLYERSSSRLRALDALRIGSLRRLAILCGLGRTASVDEVIAAVSGITGADLSQTRQLLVDATPHSDRELIAASDALLKLERDVAAAAQS